MSYGLKILSANGRTVINTDESFVGQKIRGTTPVSISVAGSSWPPTGLLSQELPMCKTRDLTSGVIGLYYGAFGVLQPTFMPQTYGAPSNGLQWWPLSKQGGAVTVANYNVDFGGGLIVSFRGYNPDIPAGSVNPTTFNSRPIRFVQWSSNFGLQIAFGSNGGNTGWTTVTVNNTGFSRTDATFTSWDGTQEVWTWSGVSNPFSTTGTFTLHFTDDGYGLKVFNSAGGLAFDGSDIGIGIEIVAAGILTAKTGTFTMEAGRDPLRYVVDVANTRTYDADLGGPVSTIFEKSYYFDRTNDKIILRNWSYQTNNPSNTSGLGSPFEYMIGYLLY